MHDRTGGDELQRQRVANKDISVRTAHDGLSDLEADGLNDVTLLAIRVVDERDTGAAVGIVLNRSDRAGDSVLLALEVDEAKLLLMTAAVMAHGHGAGGVTTTGAGLDGEQRLVRFIRRDVVVDQLRSEAERRGNRSK